MLILKQSMFLKRIERIIVFLKYPLLFLLFSILVLKAFSNISDLDCFFHLKSGEYIVTHKEIPRQDVFSFTMEGKSWTNHEWLYQAGLFTVYEKMGPYGLFVLKAALFSLAFFLFLLILMRTDWLVSFFLLLIGLRIAFWRFTLRPDNFSFLFQILFLLPFAVKKRKALFLLPLVQVFWVNMHGFFFLGPLILGLYLIAGKIRPVQTEKNFYQTVKIVFILCLAACFVSPYPIAMVQYPLKTLSDVFSGTSKAFYQNIQELQSPFRHIPQSAAYLVFLVITSIGAFFIRRISLFLTLAWIFFVLFSANALRNSYFLVPIGIIVFAQAVPRAKELCIHSFLKKNGVLLLRVVLALGAVFIGLNLVKEITYFDRRGKTYWNNDDHVYLGSIFLTRDYQDDPGQLIDFIKKHDLPQRMFNNFNSGAHLIFNCFPRRKVFIDGRGDFYGPEFFVFHQKVLEGDRTALHEAIAKYELDGFILEYTRQWPPRLIKELYSQGFQCVYFGRDGIIFISPKAFAATESFAKSIVDFKRERMPAIDFMGELKLYQPPMNGFLKKAYVLYLLGFYEQSKAFVEEILEISPNDAKSYYLLAQIYYRQKEYEKAFQNCRKSLLFKPGSRSAQGLLARIYTAAGQEESAREITTKLKVEFNEFIRKEMNDERDQ